MAPMVRYHARPVGAMVLKIHVFTDGPDRAAVDQGTVAEVRGAADRGRLRDCERTHHGERRRHNDCFDCHAWFPSVPRENKDRRGWLHVASRRRIEIQE